ncbi:ROK family glucokinase [Microbacterium sp. cx-55]|uniref:ROK family glucokinase n=1 Tax=Microbacterium sp. cx-55 TaxID=2875948 RepID=UPI001CBD60BC|nr:ROK family glucokinase [Microbacterium sp. cx-55]MBZ4486661.1 ROK family glucokinase [Microbacterium sp. cx-55]UGB36377.1 ROK family glucokinase [Microbacterium sp. cx-55]
MLAVGIDIGGTKIAGGIVDESGTMVRSIRVPTPVDIAEIESAVAAMVTDLAAGEQAVAGVAAAGFIDRDRSKVYFAPNIAWRDEPLRDRLEALTGIPVLIENDANAAGWAEYRYGAGENLSDVVMLTLGTGVGGAVVVDGTLLRGGQGSAAELGHMRVIPDGRTCGCGQRGCLEVYGSGRALQLEAREIAQDAEFGIGQALAEAARRPEGLTGAVISQLVQADDPGAREALRRIAVAVGTACGSFAAILDPQRFVIGGGVSQLGEVLLAPMRDAFAAALPASGSSRPMADFAVARLTNDAGVIGVADLARRRYLGGN